MPVIMVIICGLLFVGFGVWVIAQPTMVANALKRFYSNYPVVKNAGDKQLTSRDSFVIGIGLTFILVGVLILLT